jgi:mycofactocin precursor
MEPDLTTDDRPEGDEGGYVDDELLVEEISIDGMCGVY